MKEAIYPTWAKRRNHWVKDMLEGWGNDGRPHLCFPWIKFNVHTLPSESFWMYLYYAKGRTDVPLLKGMIEFRVRVDSWRYESIYDGDDIYSYRSNEDGKVWFLCDKFEKIVKENGKLLSLMDFRHAYGKNLVSAIRNSIPQVTLQNNIRVVQHYP